MARRRSISLPISVDGRPVASETLLATAGAYVVVLATVLPDHGVEVHSTYLGHADADTQAGHLLLAPGVTPATETIAHSEHALPVVHARRRCLIDHANVVLAFLKDLDHQAGIDVEDAAITAVET